MSAPRGLTIALILALAVTAVVGWLRPRPAAEVRYRDVVVPETILVRGEPDTIIRWRERLVTRVVPAEQAATAPAAAVPDVAAFCGAAGWIHARERGDTVAPGSPVGPPIPRQVLLRSMSYDGRELRVWGPRSDGDLWTASYRVSAPLSARVMGDTVLVQGSRWAGARRWADRAAWMAAGAGAGVVARELSQ